MPLSVRTWTQSGRQILDMPESVFTLQRSSLLLRRIIYSEIKIYVETQPELCLDYVGTFQNCFQLRCHMKIEIISYVNKITVLK